MAQIVRLRSRVPGLPAVVFAGLAATASAAGAQEAEPDTLPLPADTAARDTAPPPFRPQLSFPGRQGDQSETSAADVWTWERADLLDSSALTLADFLQDRAPGVHVLRAGYYYGEHQMLDGLVGPAGVRVLVDGVEVLPLASGQPDLSRISLAAVDRIQLERRAGETLLRIELVDHPGGEAYSRINAGTGQPAADLLRGVFTNGAGRTATVAGAVDHLNVDAGAGEGSRLDAYARGSWMPLGPDHGVQLTWRNESVERGGGSALREFTRRELTLRFRSKVADGIQVEAWGSTTERDPQPPFLPAPPAEDPPPGGEPAPAPEEDVPPVLTADQAGARVTVRRDGWRLEGRYALVDADGLPDARGSIEGGVRLGPVVFDGSLGRVSWGGFSTSVASAGLAVRPRALPLSVRVAGATGSRAVALPGRTATDSTAYDFDAVEAGTTLELGPYRLGGTVSRGTQDRRPPFGGSFDRLLPVGGEARVTFLEGRFSGPLVPFGFLRERVLLEGFWREASFEDEAPPPYFVPRSLARGNVAFHDRFFDDNLEVRLALVGERRGEMVSARPESSEPRLLEPRTVLGTDLLIRIDVFRIWWRIENLRSEEHRDFVDLPFPTQRNVVGVRWEFFN